MTIREAHTLWGREAEHVVIFKRTKDVFESGFKILDMEKATSFYSKKDMSVALAYSSLKPKEKSVAASVMFHVMKFAHDIAPSQQNAIDWGYTDLLSYNICAPATDPAELTSVLGTANPSAFSEEHENCDSVTHELSNLKTSQLTNPKTKTVMKKKDDKKPKPVKRIDPKAGTEISYESISAAQRATGIKNISRAIESKGKAGGYMWEYTTAPIPDNKPEPEHGHEGYRNTSARSTAEDSRKQALEECTNQELVNEMRRRGWKGDIEVVEKVRL